ncbi:hypothetical protein PF007_g268 [Phytophthora fragariae]|uniref:AWS domain-containing protein n=1 Tax=Phytophthora fragariae TaxID=53985 RepID=A0A6A3TVM2_9STRA|nr:hypothetical protein PF007_g268 [Phytophthora fragariae]
MVNDAAEDYYQRRTRLRIQSDRSWSKLATISVTRLASTYFFFFWKTVLMPQDTRRQLTIESTFAVEDDGAQRLSSRYQQGRIRDERSVLQAFAEYDDVDQNMTIFRTAPAKDVLGNCGESCENRASQTECLQGHCFTRTRCGNQRFQEGTHVALGLRSVELRGITLVADEHIAQGIAFLGQIVRNASEQK